MQNAQLNEKIHLQPLLSPGPLIGDRIVACKIINEDDVNSLVGCRVYIRATEQHFEGVGIVPEILPRGEASVSVVCRQKAGVKMSNLPTIERVEVESKEGVIVAACNSKNTVAEFGQALMEQFTPPKEMPAPYKILLVGPAASGKSSHLQTFATVVSNHATALVRGLTAIGGGVEHVTRALRFIPLHANVQFVDTWGITKETYKEEKIDVIAKGKLPDGWTMDSGDDVSAEDTRRLAEHTQENRRADAVIFFATYGLIKDKEELAGLKRHFETLSHMDISPILIVARTDEFCPAIRDNAMEQLPQVMELCDSLAKEFNIPRNQVMHGVPYTKENERDFNIDRLNYQILEVALECARTHRATRRPIVTNENRVVGDYTWKSFGLENKEQVVELNSKRMDNARHNATMRAEFANFMTPIDLNSLMPSPQLQPQPQRQQPYPGFGFPSASPASGGGVGYSAPVAAATPVYSPPAASARPIAAASVVEPARASAIVMPGRVRSPPSYETAQETREEDSADEADEDGFASVVKPPRSPVEAASSASAQPAPMESVVAEDRLAQLERLLALRSQGILDDAELAAEKKKILGS